VGRETGGVYQYIDPTKFTPVSTTHDAYATVAGGGTAPLYVCPSTANNLGGLWCNSNLGRGAIPGPKFTDVDFGVSKNFKITERMKVRFDANFFNLFNHPNFQNPQSNISDPAFGQSQLTYGDTGGHRVTQLALRFDF
jgi:hypothetical protein